MDFGDYQVLADRSSGATGRTAAEHPRRLATAALGLAGEAGEVCDLVKKHIGHGHDLSREKVAEELGDLLWYVAETATALGLSLEGIAMSNIDKLRKRYPQGFTRERSINREVNS